MRSLEKIVSTFAIAALLASCGGGGGSSGGGATGISPPPPPPPPVSTACSLRSRQDFVLSALNANYLFPETLPANSDPTPFATVTEYIDFLTATARSQRRDRFFTFITSIAEENAFNTSGATAGFGIRLMNDATARRTFIIEAFEGAPALAAGIDRGAEIIAIGTTPDALRNVSDIIAAEGTAGVSNALGPSTAGLTRILRITDAQGTRDLSVTKGNFSLSPVSSRYGSRIIEDNGRRIGYLNLRTFISSADPQLRTAFDQFRSSGISQFIIDFRYNGGGLISTAQLMGDLLGGNRSQSEVFSTTVFRPERSASNAIKRFNPQAQSVSPLKIAFITTGASASASELVINSFVPYLGANLALIGGNSFGKPVGQIAVDQAACDDRLRVVAFSTRNAAGFDDYFNGLAASIGTTCQAADDVTRPLGDAQEASVRTALDFLAGRSCTPIVAGGQTSQSSRTAGPTMLSPANPTVAQREIPGLF
ncbi:MAG: S41 family peptidase [Pseudomonadota bacterium]